MNARHRSILTAISVVVLPLGVTGAASGGISSIGGVGTDSRAAWNLPDQPVSDRSWSGTHAAAGGYLTRINSAPDDQFIDSLLENSIALTGSPAVGSTRAGPAAPTESGQVESDNAAATGAAASSVPLPSAALMFFPGAGFALLAARQMRRRARRA